jgi:hypothetical protein
MQPVEISEVKNIAEYELIRPQLRPRMMALKEQRRIHLGKHLTFLFENRQTVLYQIQEMMRIERMVKPEDIAHEVETYNELVPAPGELSASLLIEYETVEERQAGLTELLGLEHHLWLEVAGKRSPAIFDARQIATDRLSAVQYIKFRLSPDQVANFAHGAALVADHPKYQQTCRLTESQLRELEADLR